MIDPAVSTCVDVHNTVVNNTLKFWGSDALKEEWMPKLATNTMGSFCLSEPGSGSDAFSLATKAELSSDVNTKLMEINYGLLMLNMQDCFMLYKC